MKSFVLILLVALALSPLAGAAPPGPVKDGCVTAYDDLVSDGGSTYCVDPTGECKLSESREYIWGREHYCHL